MVRQILYLALKIYTALHYAVTSRYLECVKYLMEHNADITRTDYVSYYHIYQHVDE